MTLELHQIILFRPTLGILEAMSINFNRVESAQSFGHPDQFFGFVVNVAILDCL